MAVLVVAMKMRHGQKVNFSNANNFISTTNMHIKNKRKCKIDISAAAPLTSVP